MLVQALTCGALVNKNAYLQLSLVLRASWIRFFMCLSLVDTETENAERAQHWATRLLVFPVFDSHFTGWYHLDVFTSRQISSVCCGSQTGYQYPPLSSALRTEGLKKPDKIQWYRQVGHKKSSTCRYPFSYLWQGYRTFWILQVFTSILSAMVKRQ